MSTEVRFEESLAVAPREWMRRIAVGELRHWRNLLRAGLLAGDALMIMAALVLSNVAKFGPEGWDDVVAGSGGRLTQWHVSIVIALIWMMALTRHETRRARVLGTGLEEYRRLSQATIQTFSIVAVMSYLLELDLSRLFFAITFPGGLLLLLLERWLLRQVLVRVRRKGRNMTPAILVGSQRSVARVAQELRANVGAGYLPVAASVPDGIPGQDVYIGSARLPQVRLADHLEANPKSAVIVSSLLGPEGVRQVAWQLEGSGAQLMVVPSLMDVSATRISLSPASGLNLLHVDLPEFSGMKYAVKRVFDIVFSALALLLLSPVLALTAIAIKLDDGGRVLFRQQRIGQDGKPFTIHKFRTMSVDAEAKIDELIKANGGRALLFKLENDPRITRLGAFLRKYSIDELPQFWTVLRGGMSIVGPRPQVAREVAEYTDAAHRRLLTKPGITGLWQVNGRSNLSLDPPTRVRE